ADAIRMLYGFGPQSQLADRGTSHHPALATSSYVDLATSALTLHMVWKGAKNDQGVYESALVSGGWTPQRKIHGIGTAAAPALATVARPGPTPSTDIVMAWRGVDGDQGLYWCRHNETGWFPQQKVNGVGSSHGPALANFGGLVMAWKGIKGDQGIYYSRLGSNGWGPQANVRGIGTSASPALVVFNGRLYMFWKGIEGDSTLYYSWLESGPGAIWQPQRRVAYADYATSGGVWKYPGSVSGPSATVRGNRILLAWRGVQGDQGIYFSLFDGQEFTGQVRVADVGTSAGPAVCTVGGLTYMAWKGIEGDSCIYWSTL
ncbi:MAG TPA: hypothetical protein VEA60_16240, partial [Allosphingosinicella sp.]|nr:hypothetical protein [Allosphingosinicella sp.]